LNSFEKIKPLYCKKIKKYEYQNSYIVVKKENLTYNFEFYCDKSLYWPFIELSNEEFYDKKFSVKNLEKNDDIKFNNKDNWKNIE
jgi:hypothetical protein